jgi:hypothetical protein
MLSVLDGDYIYEIDLEGAGLGVEVGCVGLRYGECVCLGYVKNGWI